MTPRHLISAPSNIALIKYMGKLDGGGNLPENASLSMTLDALSTWVSIEPSARGEGPRIDPGVPEGAPATARAPRLSEAGRDKMLRHVARAREQAQGVLKEHGIAARAPEDWVLRTANTFPEASGIASSASSFAAVTLAVALSSAAEPAAFARAWDRDTGLRRALARVARQGSGSSCRSFEGPWVEWSGDSARALEHAPSSGPASLGELSHFVVLISSAAKAVSSSEAHARVKGSPLWQGRAARAERRLADLRDAIRGGDLARMARLAWSESWEMHSLFHTAAEPFTYWKPGSLEALEWLAPQVTGESASIAGSVPPIVTMDAGPNVHVIVPREQESSWRERLVERFGAQRILEDRPGSGARIVAIGDRS